MLDAPEPCPGFAELISAGIDGALAADEARTLEAHLERCAVCRDHEGRVRRLVTFVRGAGPLVTVGPDALDARLGALDARLARDSARQAPMPRTEPDSAPDDDPDRAPDGDPEEPARRRPIAWGDTLRPVLKVAVVLLFVGASVLFLQAQWRAFRDSRPKRPGPHEQLVVAPTEVPTTEPPTPATEAPAPLLTPPPPPPATETPPPDVDPSVQPIPPEPPEPVPPVPPPATEAAPPAGDPTRERAPGSGSGAPRPAVQLATRPQVEALIASILDRRTPPEQRLSQLASLGDLRFDQPAVYELLAVVLLDGRLDDVERANECRWTAMTALGALGTDDAARILLRTLAGPVREAQRDLDDATLCAALAALRDDAAIDLVARALVRLATDEDRGLLALRALAQDPRPAAVDGLLELYGAREGSLACLREAGAVLGATGDPRALRPLLVAIEDGRTTHVRQGAALGLGALAARRPEHATSCLAALGHAARERDLGVACAAVRGLRTTGAREAIPLLIARLDLEAERRGPVRALALDALTAMTGQVHRSHRAWSEWWNAGPALPAPGQPRLLPQAAVGMLAFFQLPSYAEGVVFVLDVSGSMGGPKWTLARAELLRALDALPREVRFEVLFMRDAPVAVFGELRHATPANLDRARKAIEAQRPLAIAQTLIGRTLERALAHAQADTIYFVSDGADTTQDDRAVRLRVARANARRDVPARIHSILVRQGAGAVAVDDGPGRADDPFDIRFMRGLSRDSGGVFVRNGW